MSAQPTVSVVIPALNDSPALPLAVASLLEQSRSVSHIVIAVGPSSDGTLDVAAQLANDHATVQVIDNPTGRTPNGLNLAIAATTGDVIVRVDARSVLPPDYVANALELMDETGAANVGAVQRPVGHAPIQRAIAAAMNSRLGSGGVAYRNGTAPQQVDTAYLGVFDRAALAEVGGYDESFRRNQDAELNERLNRAGHQVWVDPRLVVDYQPRRTLRALWSQFWQYGWWRRKTAKKHPGSLRPRQMVPPLVIVAVLLGLVASLWIPWAAMVPVGYVAVMLATSLSTSGLRLGERLAMAAALLTMHVSWAAGFVASSVALVFAKPSRQ